MREVARMFLQIGHHKRTIGELEALVELNVNVIVTETTDTVTLENGKRMTSSRINVGEMLWSPFKDVVEDTTSRTERIFDSSTDFSGSPSFLGTARRTS